jgi:hypothetical protein
LWQRCGKRQNSSVLILVEGVKKHVFFCDPFNSTCLLELEQSIPSTAPFVPIQDPIHPSLLWLSSCTSKLKENSLLDDILVENSKIDPKMKRKKSAFC